MSQTCRIALLQAQAAPRDPAANLAHGLALCQEAARMGADIALFPEMWQMGYAPPPTGSDPASGAIDAQSDFVAAFQALAHEQKVAIGLTVLEAWPGGPRDTLHLIDRHGEIVLTYAKVHTCDFSPMEAAFTPGDAWPVAVLDTASGPLNVGAMICCDREFPESARLLMLNGAELILVPNACELEALRIGQVQARAFENMAAIAVANYPPPIGNGHSHIYDGVAFAEIDGPSRDMLVVMGGEAAGLIMGTLDVERLRHYRQREAWADAFRKPDRYAGLCDDNPLPVFQRGSSRRRTGS